MCVLYVYVYIYIYIYRERYYNIITYSISQRMVLLRVRHREGVRRDGLRGRDDRGVVRAVVELLRSAQVTSISYIYIYIYIHTICILHKYIYIYIYVSSIYIISYTYHIYIYIGHVTTGRSVDTEEFLTKERIALSSYALTYVALSSVSVCGARPLSMFVTLPQEKAAWLGLGNATPNRPTNTNDPY